MLLMLAPIPASFAKDPFATHRAIPMLLPLVIIITVSVDRMIINVKKYIWIPVLFLFMSCSLLLLWRSYFVLLPNERAKVWGYGLSQLASEVRKYPGIHYVIDQSRMNPVYINMAFFLDYPPGDFQKSVDQGIKKRYYSGSVFNPQYKFANIETRSIEWEKDIYKRQILVGDEFAISSSQAEEHFLKKLFEIRDPVGDIVFVGYSTDPEKKCMVSLNETECSKLK